MSTKLKDARELLSKPGDSILETITHLKMSQVELAERMGRTSPKVNDIITGKEPITNKTALQLEKVLGIDAQFWLNLEMIYRDKLQRIEEEEYLETYMDWLRVQPIKELQKCGYIKTDKPGPQMAEEMLRFYGVATPDQWHTLYVNHYGSASFRKSEIFKTSLGSMAAWLRMGELEMRKLNLGEYNKEKFKEVLKQARELASQHPENFSNQLKELCAEAGVAVVYTLCLPKSPVSGATRWIGGNPLIQITDRYKTNDHFWFTFFHEAGHVLLHGKKQVFLEDFDGYEVDQKKEEEANSFSSKWLLPDDFLNKLPSKINESDIEDIAEKYNMHPGIIVGRLQRYKKVPYSFGTRYKAKVSLF